MKTMTVDEYRPLLIDAIKGSKDRWKRLKANAHNVPACKLCKLASRFDTEGFYYNIHQNVCPFYKAGNDANCSDGWGAWAYSGGRTEEIAAANQVLTELDAIDVEAWIKVLVEREVLISDN